MIKREMIEPNRSIAFKRLLRDMWKDKGLYILLFPGMLYFVLFSYIPMYGIVIAFQDYSVVFGFDNAPWVGFEVFYSMFSKVAFQRALLNTIKISLLKMVFYFPTPIILALLINEVRNKYYRKVVQTTVILPHFISWIIIYGLMYSLFNVTTGVIPQILSSINETFGTNFRIVNYMSDKSTFIPLLIISSIWASAGYGTIIYLASFSGIDPTLYEAAMIDGAGRWRQTWHITLAGVRSTIVMLLIMRMGGILNAGFGQIFILSNAMVQSVADIIDTYVYRVGIENAEFSLATAAGLFKSIIGLCMVLGTNYIARKLDADSAIL